MDAWMALVLIVGFFGLVGMLVFLVVSRAFREMGFSSVEAVVILVASFVFGQGILDGWSGVPFSGIPVFSVSMWEVAVNVGGAVVPVMVSLYLVWRRRLPVGQVVVGVGVVGVVAFLVTVVDPARGIVAGFPWWLAPVVVASVCSLVLCWGEQRKAAPFAYVVGVCGVLVGADLLHLPGLLSGPVVGAGVAVIGGASVFDMVFTTGVLAVLVDCLVGVRSNIRKEDPL